MSYTKTRCTRCGNILDYSQSNNGVIVQHIKESHTESSTAQICIFQPPLKSNEAETDNRGESIVLNAGVYERGSEDKTRSQNRLRNKYSHSSNKLQEGDHLNNGNISISQLELYNMYCPYCGEERRTNVTKRKSSSVEMKPCFMGCILGNLPALCVSWLKRCRDENVYNVHCSSCHKHLGDYNKKTQAFTFGRNPQMRKFT